MTTATCLQAAGGSLLTRCLRAAMHSKLRCAAFRLSAPGKLERGLHCGWMAWSAALSVSG